MIKFEMEKQYSYLIKENNGEMKKLLKTSSSKFLLVFLLIINTGCDSDSNAVNSNNGFYWGGTVLLHTETGATIENKSGVKIYLEGTSFQTYTKYDGSWRIYGIPAGTYNLVAIKDGFGYHKFIDFEYLGNVNNDHFWQVLIGTPTYSIDSITINEQNNIVTMTGFPSNTVSYLRFVLVYFGKEDPIYDIYSTWEYQTDTRIYAQNNFFTSTFSPSELLNNGFNAGDTVHIAIYPGSRFVERFFLNSEYKLINSSGVGPVPYRTTYILQ